MPVPAPPTLASMIAALVEATRLNAPPAGQSGRPIPADGGASVRQDLDGQFASVSCNEPNQAEQDEGEGEEESTAVAQSRPWRNDHYLRQQGKRPRRELQNRNLGQSNRSEDVSEDVLFSLDGSQMLQHEGAVGGDWASGTPPSDERSSNRQLAEQASGESTFGMADEDAQWQSCDAQDKEELATSEKNWEMWAQEKGIRWDDSLVFENMDEEMDLEQNAFTEGRGSSWAAGRGPCFGGGCRAGGGACRTGCCSCESQAPSGCGSAAQPIAGETLSRETGGGAAAAQQPEQPGGVGEPATGETSCQSSWSEKGGAAQQPEAGYGAAESECGGPAQQLPLDNYAHFHSLGLDCALRDIETGLNQATRNYEAVCKRMALQEGWLSPKDYCFTGKGSLAWNAGRAQSKRQRREVVVAVPVPVDQPRKKVSSSTGEISASAVRYRRFLTAYVRGLYFQLIIRNHCTDEAVADGSGVKTAGGKRKRDGAEEGNAAAASEAGATVAGEKQSSTSPHGGDTGGNEEPAADQNDSIEGKKKDGKRARRGNGCSSYEQKRMEAAISAFLSDLPLPLLKTLLKNSRVQSMAIKSEKKVRKKILMEIKMEARRTKQDPLRVLETAVRVAGSAGSMRQYSILGSLVGSTTGSTLPSAENVAKAKRELMEMAVEDLQLKLTPDGYRISLQRAVEMEALRLMQRVSTSKNKESRLTCLDPDRVLHWQDFFHVKLTFDARRVTKHCAQTEVMIIFLPKGQDGVDRCQKAVHMRTIAVWTGKDSTENVVRNLTEIVKEAAQLESKGIAFSRADDSFLGVAESDRFAEWLKGREQRYKDLQSSQNFTEWLTTEESGEPAPYRRVGMRFWVAADMLAQCSLIGQGCAGHHYCAHCNAHKENRHLPFELFKVKKPTNFWQLANDNDTKVETLWAINTCEDLGAKGCNAWKLTDEGLMACTLPCLDKELARAKAPCRAQAAEPPRPVPARPQAAPVVGGELRASKGAGKPRRTAAAVAAAPVKSADPQATSPEYEFPTGPDSAVIKRCDGWKTDHKAACNCVKCVIPAGTIVRRLIQPGFDRASEYLDQHWTGVSRARFPLCALHCNMRITEAMFYNVCQNALAAGDPAVARLNSAMEMIGLKSKKFQKVRMFNSENYERLSFLGHEALHLLKRDEASGKRRIQMLLEHLWPEGDASESKEGLNFVKRSIVLWDCWGEVVELMSERNPENLRKSVDDRHGDGFARFGKVCREFCFRYQSFFHKTHCKSFYLHTIMAHAGDFMRELEKNGMCLGMMSNSGAERRHEYGRRAFRRSLCGGCWAKHDPELAGKANMSAFLTLREILIWQYGSDLLSHEKARRAAAALKEAQRSSSSPDESGAAGAHSPPEAPLARSKLTAENLEKHCSNTNNSELDLNQLLEPLLTPTEEVAESQPEATMEEESNLGETARPGWTRVLGDQVLTSIPVPTHEADALTGTCYSCSAGVTHYDAGGDPRLTNNIADVVSDIDGDGSEDCSSDGSDSDCAADRVAGVRFDAADFDDDDDDAEYEVDGADEAELSTDDEYEKAEYGGWSVRRGGQRSRATAAAQNGRQGASQEGFHFEFQYVDQAETTGSRLQAVEEAHTNVLSSGSGGVSGRGDGAGSGHSGKGGEKKARGAPARTRVKGGKPEAQKEEDRKKKKKAALRSEQLFRDVSVTGT